MKTLLAVLLLVLSISATQAETFYVYEDDMARISLNNKQCDDAVITALILPEFVPLFYKFTMLIKTKEMAQLAGGHYIIEGCWTDNYEIVPHGLIAFINQFGGYGYVPLSEFSPIKPGVDVRVN